MTIDEAIAQEKEMAMTFETKDFAEYHDQLAKWLEELKSYRLHIFSGDMTQKMLKEQYNKAIDDFVAKLVAKEEKLFEPDCGGMLESSYERSFNNGILAMDDAISEIAEQLKAGADK